VFKVSSTHTRDFDDVLAHELERVRLRRIAQEPNQTDVPSDNVRDRAKKMDLFGVAFSGGGIRSATFCLGILQALGKLKLLRKVDYLSTVSGGGYIGGWLAGWIRRETDGLADPVFSDLSEHSRPSVKHPGAEAVRNVEKQLDPDRLGQARSYRRENDDPAVEREHCGEDPEPSPLYHIRAYSRYLAPRGGLLSLDQWSLLAIYTRNLFINSLIVLPMLATFVFAVRSVIRFSAWSAEVPNGTKWRLFYAFLVALLGAQFLLRTGLGRVRSATGISDWWFTRFKFVDELGSSRLKRLVPRPKFTGFLLLLAGMLFIWLCAPENRPVEPYSAVQPSRMPSQLRAVPEGQNAGAPTGQYLLIDTGSTFYDYVRGCLLFGALGLGFGLLAWFASGIGLGKTGSFWGGWHFALLNLLFGILLGAILTLLVDQFLYSDGVNRPVLFAVVGPPLFLLGLLLASQVEVGVAGNWYSEHEREWRSRLTAWLLLLAVGWAVVFSIVAYLPQVFDSYATVGSAAVAFTGGLTAVLRWLVPRLVKSPSLIMVVAVKLVPLVFLTVLLALTSYALDAALADEWSCAFAERLTTEEWWIPLVGAGVSFFITALFVVNIPVNRFSLHSLYANRLTRCYLGASLRDAEGDNFNVATAVRDRRNANTFSQFDPADDLPLVVLRATAITTGDCKTRQPGDRTTPYFGPYPIFNTTLNMVAGTELAYQDRRGESFILTPDYCGSDSTGYDLINGGDTRTDARLSDTQGPHWNLTVGRAITISGAAVDPNMANYYSVQFTAFLTILNARLGWWLRNPKWHSGKRGDWEARAPWGSWHYLKELFGYTDETSSFVHLSDGGHYENTGAYELIRRRCRFVLVVDAAENPDNTSENLANLVRVVHTDFGIRIQVDTAPLKRGPDGRTTWHCAVGSIRYDDVDVGGVIGTLVFVRSSLTGDEPADIKNYASVTPEFPHHPTYDQFFDEAQFESYRGLGFHIGMNVLEEAALSIAAHKTEHFNRRFFAKLRRTWTPATALQTDKYLESCRDFLLQIDGDDGRAHERRLTGDLADIFRNIGNTRADVRLATESEDDRVQVKRAQLMEMAWLMNDLDRSYSHPIQRGWVNTMRAWTTEPAFQAMWPQMRTVFSQGFVRFCERALNVNQPSIQLLHVTATIPDIHAEKWESMRREFGQDFLPYLTAKVAKPNGRPNEVESWWKLGTNPGKPEEYLSDVLGKDKPQFWLIGYGEPGIDDAVVPSESPERLLHIVGVVALFDPILPFKEFPRDSRELLLWIRGKYRMAGIGGVAMRLLNGNIRGVGVPVFSRLPRLGSGPAESLQRAMWIQFMNDFDFYGIRPLGPEALDWEKRELRVQFTPAP